LESDPCHAGSSAWNCVFPKRCQMRKMIREWKRWLARLHEFEWQDGFFEHRLRSQESAEAKAQYIRMNPIRAGLINESESWPYQRDWKASKD
jgi:putative transposase